MFRGPRLRSQFSFVCGDLDTQRAPHRLRSTGLLGDDYKTMFVLPALLARQWIRARVRLRGFYCASHVCYVKADEPFASGSPCSVSILLESTFWDLLGDGFRKIFKSVLAWFDSGYCSYVSNGGHGIILHMFPRLGGPRILLEPLELGI